MLLLDSITWWYLENEKDYEQQIRGCESDGGELFPKQRSTDHLVWPSHTRKCIGDCESGSSFHLSGESKKCTHLAGRGIESMQQNFNLSIKCSFY